MQMKAAGLIEQKKRLETSLWGEKSASFWPKLVCLLEWLVSARCVWDVSAHTCIQSVLYVVLHCVSGTVY